MHIDRVRRRQGTGTSSGNNHDRSSTRSCHHRTGNRACRSGGRRYQAPAGRSGRAEDRFTRRALRMDEWLLALDRSEL